MNLTLDRSDWVVCSNVDGTHRVASEGTQKVIASSVSLSVGTQMVDEHKIALRVYDLLANFPDIVDVDNKPYRRALRVV
jgi:hypothetical protein